MITKNLLDRIFLVAEAVPDAIAIATILRDTYQYQLIHPNCDPGRVIANKHATLQKLKTLLTNTLPNQIKPTKSDRFSIKPLLPESSSRRAQKSQSDRRCSITINLCNI